MVNWRKPLSNSSYARNLFSKIFYRYLNRFEGIKANPVYVSLRSGSIRRKLPEFLTFDQMETLLNQFDLQDPVQIRNRCIIESHVCMWLHY